MKATKGQILMLEWGSYDSKGWDGPLRALRDFDLGEAATEFRAAYLKANSWIDDPDDMDWPSNDEFAAFLIQHRYAEAVECLLVNSGWSYTLEKDAAIFADGPGAQTRAMKVEVPPAVSEAGPGAQTQAGETAPEEESEADFERRVEAEREATNRFGMFMQD